ncbi:YbgC/FadM family acyl-CoA thioesterase [Campylobacter mucosalis]|uniref:Acyl-CoA thioesterase n=1 Tax=Campylobacter mucosalis CCUG 21559 TaxID=1032067 RepID=A0A6G5QIK3_9BACT|nr:YbgC/FadM family acyl-CoA thioesterase [Campylobacter mucosalis]QCD45444.1 acyl-CoA thioesterase [Campylobacter mucosalis CCUG 21559]
MKVRVYYEDTDAGGVVYHANYFKFCERARSELFFNSPLKPFSNECNFVVSGIESAKFLKPARLGDLLVVKSSVTQINRASVVLIQEIFRIADINGECDEVKIFSSQIILACLKNGKATRMSDELVQFFKSLGPCL